MGEGGIQTLAAFEHDGDVFDDGDRESRLGVGADHSVGAQTGFHIHTQPAPTSAASVQQHCSVGAF